MTGAGQWLLTRLSSGNGIDITAAIWFRAGQLPAFRTLGSAVLSIVIDGMGASLGREGAPKQAGAAFGNLFSDRRKLSDEQRRLMVAIGAGAGMAAVYSVPLGGALFVLEVLRGMLSLRLVLPALAAATIYRDRVPRSAERVDLHGARPCGHARGDRLRGSRLTAHRPVSVAFVRAIAWADRARPSGWRRLAAPPLAFLAVASRRSLIPKCWATGRTSPSSCSPLRSRP